MNCDSNVCANRKQKRFVYIKGVGSNSALEGDIKCVLKSRFVFWPISLRAFFLFLSDISGIYREAGNGHELSDRSGSFMFSW